MKKIIFKLSVITFFLLTTLLPLWSQPPPPSGHGQTNNQPAGTSAPLGGGTIFLLIMAVCYGGRKIYVSRFLEGK